MTSNKKLVTTAVILSIAIIVTMVGMVIALVLSSQRANSSVKVKYTAEDVWVRISANAYVGDTTYIFKNGDDTELELSPDTMIGSLSQTEDEIELSTTNRKIIFEYKFENLTTDVDAVITKDGLPETQKNVNISYSFSDTKIEKGSFTSLSTTNTYVDQLLPAYEDKSHNFRYIYVIVDIASLNEDADFRGEFVWGLNRTVAQTITINNSQVSSSNTVAKTLAGNQVFMPPAVELTNKYFQGFYSDSNYTNQIVFPIEADETTEIHAKYLNGNIPASNISYHQASNSYHVVNELDSSFTGNTLIIPDLYEGPNGVLPITAIESDGAGSDSSNEYGLLSRDTKVENLYIGNNVTQMSYVASYFNYSNLNTDGSNNTLRSVEVGRGVKSLSESFFRCSNLSEMKIHNNTLIGYTWHTDDATKLSELYGTKLSVIQPCDNKNRYILVGTGDATDVSEIENYDKVTEYVSTAFWGTKLTNLVLPEYITDFDFSYSNLQTVTLHSNVRNIKQYAFLSCNNLTSIVIPSSVKSISAYAFGGCNNLNSITFASPYNWVCNGQTYNLTNPSENANMFKNTLSGYTWTKA